MANQIEKLKKAIEVLESPHVAEVKVNYRGMFDDVRYYDVTTHYNTHRYTVKVQDWFNETTSDMERWAKCNCAAGAADILCRHILKVAQIDSEKTGQDLFLDTVQNYKGHLPSTQMLNRLKAA